MDDMSVPNSPLVGLNLHFTDYLEAKKSSIGKHVMGNGLPDYAFGADLTLRKKLDSMPGLHGLFQKVLSTEVPRAIQHYNQNGIKVTPNSFPDVYKAARKCASLLGIGIPNLYIIHDPSINAFTIACDDSDPIIVLHSGIVERTTIGELQAVIGHEFGHIQNHHTIYTYAVEVLANATLTAASGISAFLTGIASRGALIALNSWSRAAETTCDRAAMICSERVDDAYNMMIKLLCGGILGQAPQINYHDLYEQLKMQTNTIAKYEEIFSDHPGTLRRIAAEMAFADCELLYDWRPDLRDPHRELQSFENTETYCHRLIDLNNRVE